jgi:threonine dehydrogenase-like Zn-dependent dehydrogenase
MYGRSGTRADFDVALDVLARRVDDAAALVTHRLPLAEIAEGYRLASDKSEKSVKVSILP